MKDTSKVIICGSKKYHNIKFDNIVDSFQTIVRTNMLLPGSGYGHRMPDIQTVNNHVYANFISSKKSNLNFYTINKGISKDHIENFDKFTKKLGKSKFKTYPYNNTEFFIKNDSLLNIGLSIKLELRCGFSYIPECIKKGIRPYLIGFSLSEEQMKQNCYTNCKVNNHGHNTLTEISLIKRLHELKLVDATFCSFKDQAGYVLDKEVLIPTKEAERMIERLMKENKNGYLC